MAPSKSKASSAPGISARRAEKAAALPPPEELSEPEMEEAAASPTKARGGRQAGALNFEEDEVYVLLDIIGEVKPAGALGWQRVTQKFNMNVLPERQRKTSGLEQKYKRVSVLCHKSQVKCLL
jgi:hypothetical protein